MGVYQGFKGDNDRIKGRLWRAGVRQQGDRRDVGCNRGEDPAVHGAPRAAVQVGDANPAPRVEVCEGLPDLGWGGQRGGHQRGRL